MEVERSVTVLAARLALEVAGLPTLPTNQEPQLPVTTASMRIPGGEPATSAAIPQPSTGTTAPTPLSSAASAADSTEGTRLSSSVQEARPPGSLVQWIVETLKETKMEERKVWKYLPDFLGRLRQDLVKELKDGREPKGGKDEHPVNQMLLQTGGGALLVAYQSFRQASMVLSI